MELLPGLHQIPINYKSRPLNLYLLRFGTESLLMDTGDAGTPAKDILPYFQSVGFDPHQLTYILLTHPDLDHTGGVYAMRTAAPQAKFLCGTLDRPQIETPEALSLYRAEAHQYWHHMGPDAAKRASFIERAGGAGNHLDFHTTFNGNETFRLGDRDLHILHLPGHAPGHLGVHLPWLNTAIIGDAVHGTANRFLDGRAAFACTYMFVDSYLKTIDHLQAMQLDHLFSCHWPDCRDNAAVNRFLDDSRTYALQAEQAILQVIQSAGITGVTLQEICLRAKPALGDWPPDRDSETRTMACGHVQRLADHGFIRTTPDRPTRYVIEPQWLGLR